MKIRSLLFRWISLLLLLLATFLALQDGLQIHWWKPWSLISICVGASLFVTFLYSGKWFTWVGMGLAGLLGSWVGVMHREELLLELRRCFCHVVPLVNQYYDTDYEVERVKTAGTSVYLLLLVALVLGLALGAGILWRKCRFFLVVLLAPPFLCGLFLGFAPGYGAAACLAGGIGMLLLVPGKDSPRGEGTARSLCALLFFVVMGISALCLPNLSKKTLEYHQEWKSYQLSLEDRVLEFLNGSSFWDDILGWMGQGKKTARLTNDPPGLSNDVIFELVTETKPEFPIYVKNFTGSDYDRGVWSSASEEEFTAFAKEQEREAAELGAEILTRGFDGKGSSREGPQQMTIRIRKDAGDLSLLPYCSTLPEQAEVAGDGGIRVEETDTYQFYAYPSTAMDIDSMQDIAGTFMDVTDSDFYAFSNGKSTYRQYVANVYTRVPMDQVPRLWSRREEAKEQLKECRYSYQLSLTPEDWDIVEYFVFRQKRGYCMHFASAYTLLNRIQGRPARYASGYLVAPEDFQENVDGTFTARVTGKRAHAWMELYSSRNGWFPVEVTPGGYENSVQAAEQAASRADSREGRPLREQQEVMDQEQERQETEEEQLDPDALDRKEKIQDQEQEGQTWAEGEGKGSSSGKEQAEGRLLPWWLKPVLYLLLAAAILAALGYGSLLLVRRHKEKRERRFADGDLRCSAAALIQETFRLLAAVDIPYPEEMDELVFAGEVESRLAFLETGEFVAFMEVARLVRYGGRPPTKEQRDGLCKVYQKILFHLKAEMKWYQRCWFC